MERLGKILANAGVASRRASARIIKEGRVTVDGEVIREPGARFDPFACQIRVDGKPVTVSNCEKKTYIMLNKPKGYVSTVHDPQGRLTILDLIPLTDTRLFPVGRLDRDTEGLLLLTDDGHATYVLTHPRFGIEKTYVAVVKGTPGEDELNQLRRGVRLQSGHMSSPAVVRLIKAYGSSASVEIKIGEGRKRQVREMFNAIGYPVKSLTRTHLGELSIGDLKVGSWRYLTQTEESWVRKMAARSEEGIRSCKRIS
ncbi:MAG: rRNA pseudouridine synthase [Firmicutes bacterium]|nr:rRNA pseudouridine synthase [Bacillota bacterium]